VHSFVRLRGSRRGGVVLDLILGFGVVLVGSFLLFQLGLTFHSLLGGAERFFGF
jgi:hypothetical protein